MTIVNETPSQTWRKFADGLERSLWTVLEGAGATGVVAGYQALPLRDIPDGYLPLVIILVAGLLAAIKSSIAQKWGNGTAATLPTSLEPIPADAAVAVTVNMPIDVNQDGRDDTTGRFLPRNPQNESGDQ